MDEKFVVNHVKPDGSKSPIILGLSVTLFDTEEHAKTCAENMRGHDKVGDYEVERIDRSSPYWF